MIQVKEFTFETRPLAVLDSLDLMSPVVDIFPSLVTANNKAQAGDALGALACIGSVFKRIRPLVEAFAGVSTVAKPPEANHQIPVTAALKTILLRQHLILMQWIVECIKAEYADFLAEAFQSQKQPENEPSSDSPQPQTAGDG